MSLQEHVDLHMEHDSTSAAGNPDDLNLARKLPEEKEQKGKEAGKRQEAKEFKKLQFGLITVGVIVKTAVSRGQMVLAVSQEEGGDP